MFPKTANSLTEGSIWKGLLFFAIPIMLSNLLQQLYNTIDSAVVGTWAGSGALAAVGSTGALINLLVGFFLGISTGAGVIYATYFGAKDEKNLHRVIDNSFILAVGAGVILTIVGVVFSPQLLRLMNTPEDVMDLAVTYLRIYFGGIIVMLVYNVGAGLIRAGGDSRRPLYYLIISGLLNLVLDILFVAIFGMGVAGAAWATVISQACSAVLVTIHMMRLPKSCRLDLLNIRFDKAASVQIIKLAIPCGIQASMFNIANLLVQTKINSFGSVAMAGVAAYTKIDGFIYTPTQAISLAVSTYVGQNIGAGKTERAKKGVNRAVILALCTSIALGGIVLLLGNHLLHMFTSDEDAVSFGLQMMHVMASTCWIFAPADILSGAMRGAGAATQVTVINALCICLFRILFLTFVLPFYMNISFLFLVYPMSWILCTFCVVIYYRKGNWMKNTVLAS